MESEVVLRWLNGSGYGSGDDSGNGSGYDYGFGSGDDSGNGSGYGYGSGFGSGDDSGNGSGFGYGYGSGDDSGNGSGDGFGSGFGSGSGNGSGDGFGNDSGYGYGFMIKKHNGNTVYYVDQIPTVIVNIKGNYARAYMISNNDYTIKKCYIAKSDIGLLAHGSTLHDAVDALNKKLMDTMSVKDKIELFCKNFEHGKKYLGKTFFAWHNKLTGSCLFGRNQFVEEHNLDLEAEYTVSDFIKICENAYGSDIINQLKDRWEQDD